MSESPRSFAEFWPFYVKAHRHAATRAFHFAGTLAGWSLLVAAIVLRNWWLLAAAIVVPYLVAWFSHFFIEHNRPATFGHPGWSWLADQKMVGLMLMGRMGQELRRVTSVGDDRLTRCNFDSKNLAVRLNVEIQADVNAITPVVDRVMNIVREMKCSEGREYEIEVSLREALANAVIHGAKRDPGKRVQFCVACDHEAGMLIIVRDPGEGFDPASIPSPVRGKNVFSEHGRGIFLINQLMDEVRFESGGTEIYMRKY